MVPRITWVLENFGRSSQNLGSVFDKSRSLVFSWFVFTFFESRNFSLKSLGLRFLTRISVSRRVSDFTIRHPFNWEAFIPNSSREDWEESVSSIFVCPVFAPVSIKVSDVKYI